MPKFTCSLTTRWVFLLGKPGKAALCSKPGSPASPLKTKSPQPCTNISGGDKERADHTVGARYVRRTAQEHLDQNLSYNPLRSLQTAVLLSLLSPPGGLCEAFGEVPFCPTAGKTIYFISLPKGNLTSQVSLFLQGTLLEPVP